MKHSWFPALGLSTTLIAAVLLFQNCSDPLGQWEARSSFAESLPFAYDTTVDTIGYMSCAGGDAAANRDAIFTFRVAAARAGSGIRLTQPFLDLTRNFTVGQRAEALGESPRNKNAVLQLSIRQAGGLQKILTSSGSSGDAGEDFANILGPLDDLAIAGQLAAVDVVAPARINYFSGISGLSGRSVVGTLRFTRDEAEANSVRGFLAGQALLTTTYSADVMPNKNARGPAGTVDGSAYGRGYRLSFTYGPGETVARVLSSVEELSLETGRAATDAGAWTCPLDMRFRVARSCSECACAVDQGNAAALAVVRSVLKVEHWYVDLTNRCVVQKAAAQQCYPTTTTGNFHFVSICTR